MSQSYFFVELRFGYIAMGKLGIILIYKHDFYIGIK